MNDATATDPFDTDTSGNVNIVTCLNNRFVHCTDWYVWPSSPTWSNQLYAKPSRTPYSERTET